MLTNLELRIKGLGRSEARSNSLLSSQVWPSASSLKVPADVLITWRLAELRIRWQACSYIGFAMRDLLIMLSGRCLDGPL